MTLNKRVVLLISPVLLCGCILVALSGYQLLKTAVVSQQQARLDHQLSELAGEFARYSSFASSYLYAITQGATLTAFLRQPEGRFRKISLGNKLEESFSTLSNDDLKFAALSVVDVPKDQTLFYYERSNNPFSSISQQQRDFAKRSYEELKIDSSYFYRTEELTSRISHLKLIDTRTYSAPMPTQTGFSVVVQLVIEATQFDKSIQALEREYQSQVLFSKTPPIGRSGLFASIQLTPDRYLSLQPSETFLDERLAYLKSEIWLTVLGFGVLLLLLLIVLIRRYVTSPIAGLVTQLSLLSSGQQRVFKRTEGDDEVARLSQHFQRLFSHLHTSYQQASRMAQTDLLTGLKNRAAFHEEMQSWLAECQSRGSHLTLLYLDLDNFKYVNDKYGHHLGDELLHLFSQRLKAILKDEHQSTGLSRYSIARLAGDEFAVALPDATVEQSLAVSNSILSLFKGGFSFDKTTLPVTVSIGTATYPEDAESFSQLISNSDSAMYQAKQQGKNQVAQYSQALAKTIRRSREVEMLLQQADFDREFSLLYMPITDSSLKLSGCEVLLRWLSPKYGVIEPDEFMPLAESSGQFSAVDRWVIKNAIHSVPELLKVFGDSFLLSLNISSAELGSHGIDQYLQSCCEASAVSPSNIELEITETFAAPRNDQSHQLLKRLRVLGFKIALDDFGTGYTSLLQLVEYPIDKVKLDRTFLRSMLASEHESILSPLIQLCHSQNLVVTAEGVESAQLLQTFAEAGCDLYQGYLMGKPMSLEQLISYDERRILTTLS